MRLTNILFIILIISIASCTDKKETVNGPKVPNSKFEFGVWATANKNKSNEEYAVEFENIKVQVLMRY